MNAHDPRFAECLKEMEAQLTSPDVERPKCRKCGLPFVVNYGRSSKQWLVLHAGGPGRECPLYMGERHVRKTQAEAIALARELAK